MRVTEIFQSIQGESTRAGRPCAFVRFTGCDLRCAWCDTPYAYEGGEERTQEEIIAQLERFWVREVTLTGGEPLLQPELPALCERLIERGFSVSVETNGQHPLDSLPVGVARIVDVKPPSSGFEDRRFLNLGHLRPPDELKFVLASREDFEWAAKLIERFRFPPELPVLLSPVHGRLAPELLVEWMLASAIPARLGLQLHKYIWGPERRGV